MAILPEEKVRKKNMFILITLNRYKCEIKRFPNILK